MEHKEEPAPAQPAASNNNVASSAASPEASSSGSGNPEVNETTLYYLMNMGFSRKQCQQALRAANNNPERAINKYLLNNDDPPANNVLPAAPDIIQVEGRIGNNSEINGKYIRCNGLNKGRVYYKKEDESHYIFWVSLSCNQWSRWCIGVFDGTPPKAINRHNVLYPTLVEKPWEIKGENGGWSEDERVIVQKFNINVNNNMEQNQYLNINDENRINIWNNSSLKKKQPNKQHDSDISDDDGMGATPYPQENNGSSRFAHLRKRKRPIPKDNADDKLDNCPAQKKLKTSPLPPTILYDDAVKIEGFEKKNKEFEKIIEQLEQEKKQLEEKNEKQKSNIVYLKKKYEQKTAFLDKKIKLLENTKESLENTIESLEKKLF